jgi:hypothetical protein
MKTRLTALLAFAAVLAVPAIASAAPADLYPVVASPASPIVDVPRDQDPTPILLNAEHDYLASTCPAVLKNPSAYSAVLDRFCREFRG